MHHHWTVRLLFNCFLLLVVCGDIHIGRSVNIFNYFGDLSVVVKVNPHKDRSWFFDQDSVEVFQEVIETKSPYFPTEGSGFDGEFQMEQCDSVAELHRALFRSLNIEGTDRPWRAFTGSWSQGLSARHLGLNSSFLTGSYGYILVRLTRIAELAELSPFQDLRVNNWTADSMERLVPGQEDTVLEFIRVSGSHYVSSYSTGDSLYQVFVFRQDVYKEIQKMMRSYETTGKGLEQLLGYFTPWHADHIGRVLSSSENSSLERWAARTLQSHFFIYFFPNLLKLHDEPQLLQDLNHLLKNEVLLSVELRSLTPFFRNYSKRLWFEEIMSNHLKMWEQNV